MTARRPEPLDPFLALAPPSKRPLSVGEALPAEMARVRDHVMPAYVEIGRAGALALSLMRASLDRAARAMAEGDVVAMIRALEDLRGYDV